MLDQKNSAILQVKENQEKLLDDCWATEEERSPDEVLEDAPEKAHGRIEERSVQVWHNFVCVNEEWNSLLSDMILVTRKRSIFDTSKKQWKSSTEKSFFVSTHPISIDSYRSIIRNHWGIENKKHYVLDEAFREDASRIRKNPLAFAALRSIALNTLRLNSIKNIASALYENSLNIPQTLALRGIAK